MKHNIVQSLSPGLPIPLHTIVQLACQQKFAVSCCSYEDTDVTGVFTVPYGGQCLNVGRLTISQKQVRAPALLAAFAGERRP
jgi:hypothetical protein